MNTDLGLDAQMYGFGIGILFFSYLLFQLPHTYILRKIGARRWIFGAVLIWGCIATAMTFINNALEFYILRFLLGMAESGFAPGIVYYVSQWMPKRFRAWAIAGTMLAIPISIIFGGPLSGWLMSMANSLALPGWRWMYLIEGSLTILAAFSALRIFVDTPTEARWLNDSEKGWLSTELENDRKHTLSNDSPEGMGSLLCNVNVWAAAGIWFSLMSGAYGIIYWLPQIIKQMSGADDLEVSTLSALPWIGLGAGMLINAWHSDKTQERYWHIGIPSVIAAVGLISATLLSSDWQAFCLLLIGAIGLGGAQGAFWALPTGFLRGANAANGITLINMLGNSGGVVTPPIIGWIRIQTGTFNASVYLLAGLLIGATTLLAVIFRSTARIPDAVIVKSAGAVTERV